MKTTWSMVVVFDDAANREQAMQVCDHLVKRFWTQCELRVSWWSVAMLAQPAKASEAVENAVVADVIILAMDPTGDLPLCVKQWTENWVTQRGDREGALVELKGEEPERAGAATERQIYLRHAAHRAGMDYLTREPETISWSTPDSLESVAARADRITTVLHDILHAPTAPSNQGRVESRLSVPSS